LKVSVIIPTYNRKHTLGRAIESIISQTIKPLEIIIVDDGSNDGTREWIKQEYPFIKYLNQNNSGVSASRNRGIFSANGNWIAFLDSDDEWIPEKLERQLSILSSDKEAVFCHTNEIWIRNGTRVNQMRKHQKYGGYIFEKCLDMCRISPSSSIIKKEVFDHIGYFDESLIVCEDYDLWLRIAAHYKILFLDQPLIKKYGGHVDQLSRVKGGIEKYRIQSLEKILSSESLEISQFNSAKEILIKKLNIYANGVRKRKRVKELDQITERIQYWINTSKNN
tara:strand:+ start:3640 stop:4476 length:837 start_codon:yes stop_codon:yes gene_type:complete